MPASPPRRLGPYRIEHRAGRGGMGEVYRAWDERLERPVAVKRLWPEADPGHRQRLLAEARALAAVDHPAVVRIHDVVSREGTDWLVMEWLEGETLARRLRQGPLAVSEAVALGERIAQGLAAIHRRGIVHRDLKAGNVLVTPAGEVKILDLGLAARLPRGGRAVPAEGRAVGTPGSLSPEQALGRPVDTRSDLFALGVLLYQALTGRSPFAAASDDESLRRLLTEPPAPVAELRPEVPAGLSEVVDRLLEKDPARRPDDAAVVATELGSFARDLDEPPEGAPTMVTPLPAISSGAPAGGGFTARHRHRVLLAAGAALALAALALALFLRRAGPWQEGPSYVAVPAPVVAGEAPGADLDLLASGLRLAALGTLAGLPGVVPLSPEQVDPVPGPPARLARAVAADEILGLRLDCRPAVCRVALSRLNGADGGLLAAVSFEVPADSALLAARAVEARLAQVYGAGVYGARSSELAVSGPDYERYLRLARQVPTLSLEEVRRQVLPALADLRASSPRFLDAYLLEMELLRKSHFRSRDPHELERALALAQTAQALFPERGEPLVKQAELWIAAGRLVEAERTLATLERIEPGSPDLPYLQARVAEEEGRLDRARELLERTARERPGWRRLHNLANFEIRHGHLDDARRHLEELLALFPESFSGQSLLAQVELMAGDPARAAELYRSLVARSPGYGPLSNLGLAQLLLGRHGEAAAAFARARELDPDNPQAVLNLADARQLEGRGAEAEALYRQVVELTGRGAEGGWQRASVRAQALAHLGKGREAVTAVQQALLQAEGNPQAAYEAALVFTLVGEHTSALVQAERALAGGVEARWLELPFFAPLAGELAELRP